MREAEYAAARAAVLAGEDPPPALLEDCRRSVRLLIHSAGLPAHYSPDGVWSPEAIEEVYADWVAVRLLGRGQPGPLAAECSSLPTAAQASVVAKTFAGRASSGGRERS